MGMANSTPGVIEISYHIFRIKCKFLQLNTMKIPIHLGDQSIGHICDIIQSPTISQGIFKFQLTFYSFIFSSH
jgi:hypothetical protein